MSKSVTLRIDEEELKKIDQKAQEAQLTRSDYIRLCLQEKPVKILAKGNDIAKGFFALANQVNNCNSSSLERGMERLCQLLNSLINELKQEED